MRTYRIVGAALAALLLTTPALAEKPDWAGGGQGGGHGKGHGQGPAFQDDGEPGNGPGHGKGAQGKEKHKGGGPGNEKGGGPGGSVTVVTRTDVDVIRQYFVSYPVGVSSLPPGIAKNLARGKPLPPGIAKKMAPIELRQRVPACMNGWECILAGADMLILDAVHGTIADIIRGVVR